MIQFEYKTISVADTGHNAIDSVLNTYGQDGWDLVYFTKDPGVNCWYKGVMKRVIIPTNYDCEISGV